MIAALRQKVRLAPQKLYEATHPGVPWLAQGAIAFLDRELDRSASGIEWGRGQSTRWFADRLAHLTSVEDNEGWYERVRTLLAGASNVRYLLREEASYTEPAADLPDASLAFCLVDGIRRLDCVDASVAKMAPGGLFVVDNTDWRPYGIQLLDHVPSEWPVVHRSRNARTETTIWRTQSVNASFFSG